MVGRCGIEFDDKGSAVTEFVMVATPLFLPAILFFNSLHSTASEEINVSHIARQAVRALATSSDLQMGHTRVKYVLDRFAEIENSNSRVSGGGELILANSEVSSPRVSDLVTQIPLMKAEAIAISE